MFDGFLSKFGYRRIPNRRKRICTVELKVNTAKRYLKSIGVIRFENFIGFRFDEKDRVDGHIPKFKKVVTKFPLYERGIVKSQVNSYWESKPYNLEIPPILGNCVLCFMKGKNAIMAILREYPEFADPWIRDEEESAKKYGHTYLEGVTIKQLRSIAQNNLFKDYDLNDVSPAFNCACTSF